jgi:rfaE bifunctional protein kinase chain/domain
MNMQDIIKKFAGLKVLVVGDVMIDAYLFGKVERISPEAPVPVVAVHKKENRLGGAANVAMNLVSLGARPTLCSVIGEDKEGEELIELVSGNGIGISGIVTTRERVTTVKTRVISQNHQMLRIDNEVTHNLSVVDSFKLVEKIGTLLSEHDVLVFEDYDKGLLDAANISQIIDKARKANVPVVVDPKKRNFMAYKGATLFKPNLKELREGFNCEVDAEDKPALERAVAELMNTLQIDNMLLTMSEYGVMISDGKNFDYVPAHVRKIADVSGAGDTVISVAALCVALGVENLTLAALSNLAGGLVCEEVGVVPIDLKLLAEEVKLLSV